MSAKKKVARSAPMSAKKKVAQARDTAPNEELPKIGKPATRALAGVGITRLDQVVRLSRAELEALHGVGPKAIRILEQALRARGLSFRAATKRDR